MSIDKVDFTIHNFIIFCDDTTLINLQRFKFGCHTNNYTLKWHKKLLKHYFNTSQQSFSSLCTTHSVKSVASRTTGGPGRTYKTLSC